jgi:8-oxo-dGTP pyrophosphatase MutT (NUDIX family)
MNFQEVIHAIQLELLNPLPGKDIQLRMSSIRRLREMTHQSQIDNGIKSSVLILLYPCSEENEISIVLIQRPSYEGIHGGQISLPGGRFEETDHDLKETAIRETKEEIGVDPGKIIIIGVLSELFIPPSNYLVLPFLGYMSERPIFKPDPKEVAGIIEIKLKDLMNDSNVKNKEIYVRPGLTVFGPCFEVENHTIWGATAMILNEFKEIAKKMIKI